MMTQKERDDRLRKKYQEMGIVRTLVWVPEDKKPELQRITKKGVSELGSLSTSLSLLEGRIHLGKTPACSTTHGR